MLFNLCVGTAVGNEISIRWLTEEITLCQKIELFWNFFTKYLNFLSCCIWCYLFWEMIMILVERYGTNTIHMHTCFVLLRLGYYSNGGGGANHLHLLRLKSAKNLEQHLKINLEFRINQQPIPNLLKLISGQE